MRRRHRRTLEAIYRRPPPAGIRWDDIESLLLACGATIVERGGSRVRVELNGVATVFHRPHPQPYTDKGAVTSMWQFLRKAGIAPDRV